MSAILPLGEAAWTVVLGDRVDRELNARVRALAARIEAARLEGVTEVVPAYAALTVFFEPAGDTGDAIRRALEGLLAEPPSAQPSSRPAVQPSSRLVAIPVRYDGPDLDQVAQRTGLTRDEVVRRHAGREYLVYFLGFAPGFGYLGDLDPALVLPRRESPRIRVPPGSVAIAGAQTAVYPLTTPGGWHLIGRTELVMFDPVREPPVLLAAGDRVRFQPMS